MRVSDQMMLGNYVRNLMNKESTLGKLNNQISSGRRISVPSDDPIGTARSMALNTNLKEVEQYTANSNHAVTWLNTADDALSTANSYLQRVYELVVSGSSSDKTTSSLADMADEVDQILDGLVQVSNTTVGNNYIFAGQQVTNPAYSMRTPATGDARDLGAAPIQITSQNNQFKIKLDQETTKTIVLTPGTYDGSSDKTLNDLTVDIQKQLDSAGFNVPVYVKATPDSRIVFYAGTRPPDGTTHSLVLKDGAPIKATGTPRVPNGVPPADQIWLASDANATNDYYTNWTIKVTSGIGMGQTRTVTGYDGALQTATLDSDWMITPDATSVYSIIPPLTGKSTAAGANTITFDPAKSSQIDNFYEGMSITVNSGPGAGETRRIVSYDHTTGVATVDSAWTTPPTASDYLLTPSLDGGVQAATAGTITLAAGASNTDGFYNGSSITVTNAGGSQETRRIVGYDATTKVATLDSNWTLPPTNTSTYSIGDTTLNQLGFYDKANTKELVGSTLTEPILVTGKYPLLGNAQAAAGVNDLTLENTSSADANYYQGWTLSIIGGTGAGQTRTVTAYNGTTKMATMGSNWVTPPDSTSQYALTPPRQGAVAAVNPDQTKIQLSNASAIQDFYKGMPITITSGNGVGQTRTITAYDPATQTATVDKAWDVLPDATSRYSIDSNYYVSSNSKFKITVGLNPTQEISLDGGNYTVKDLANQIQSQIQARGGVYANVHVSATPENQLRFSYLDPTLGDNDNPLSIKLESGSSADILTKIGFNNGVRSETPIPNYEGDQGVSEYEVNIGTRLGINTIGDKVFDSLFQHLNKISQNLRTANTTALSATDLKNLKDDIQKVLLAQGESGSKVNRLEKGLDRLASVKDSVNKMISDVEDTDITQTALDYKAQETAYEAALMIGANILPKTLMDYLK